MARWALPETFDIYLSWRITFQRVGLQTHIFALLIIMKIFALLRPFIIDNKSQKSIFKYCKLMATMFSVVRCNTGSIIQFLLNMRPAFLCTTLYSILDGVAGSQYILVHLNKWR